MTSGIVSRLRALRPRITGCMSHLSECAVLDGRQCDCGYEQALADLSAITDELEQGLRDAMNATREAQDATILLWHAGSAQEAIRKAVVALQRLGGAA